MSLGQVAGAAGLAKSTLHALEQGGGNPTLATLWSLATALGVPIGELLTGDSPMRVVRAGDGPVIEGEAVRARLLHRLDAGRVIELYEVDITDNEQRSAPHRPGVMECVVVTAGAVRVGPSHDTVELGPGDSAVFEAAVTHAYTAVGGDARAVLVMVYP